MNKSKRQKVIMEKIEELKVYSLTDAISLIQSFPKLKFNESIDISVNLGVDPKKSDQNVRGSSSLPHGIGKVSKVAVFAEGPEAADATKAGADIVGFEDLIEDVKKNKDLDVNNQSSSKPSDTYIEVILSNGKKLSYISSEQKKIIKDLENTKL